MTWPFRPASRAIPTSSACAIRSRHGIPDGDLKRHRDFAVWYATKWTRRVIDAIDQFSTRLHLFRRRRQLSLLRPGTGRGLRADATPRVIAHLYNKSMAEHGGSLDAMAFTKGNEDPRAVAVNCESHVPGDIKRDAPGRPKTAWASGSTSRARSTIAAW